MSSTISKAFARLAAGLVLCGAAAAQGSDNCSGAQPISGEGIFSFNNSGANSDGGSDGLCNAFGTADIDNDVWFAWTSDFSGTATVSTCSGTSIDSKIAAYAGTSCGGSAIACNDDSCGLQSTITFSATSGSTYLLRIGTFPGSSGGSGSFEVSSGGGGGGGCTNPSSGPDVIVGDLPNISRYGSTGGVAGYAIGTTSCNIGDDTLLWISSTNQHPVIGQNIFRVEEGRIDQIGQGWLKHGFLALTGNVCCTCQNPGTGSLLGVGCSDPYSSSLNGQQSGLGPRSEVNPFTGAFNYPFTTQGQTGNNIYKRVQVANDDLSTSLHPGATMIAEAQYVTPDDSAAGNQANNVSHRRMTVGNFSSGSWQLSLTGTTRREEAAIYGWQDVYPAVQLETVAAPGDGHFIVGSHAFELSPGVWRYEYAVYNQISDRAARALSIPVGSGLNITDVRFHDVQSHSGEPYSNADWTYNEGSGVVSWSTQTINQNVNANAIRWGTLYSFGFTADAAPQQVPASLDLFKQAAVNTLSPMVSAPGDGSGCVGSTSNYCVTSANSVGAGAVISSGGTTSIAANNFSLIGSGAPANQFGLFYYGAGQSNAPFGDGVRCVAAGGVGTFRLNPPSTVDFFGQLFRTVDYGALSGAGAITAGSTWNFQLWYRDPAAGGTGFNLSDGLEAAFCP